MEFLLYLFLPGHKKEFFVCIAFLVLFPIFGFFVPGFSFFGGIGFAWNIAVLWMLYLGRNDADEAKPNSNSLS